MSTGTIDEENNNMSLTYIYIYINSMSLTTIALYRKNSATQAISKNIKC